MYPAPSLIRQFAAVLDERLEKLEIRLIHGPDESREEHQIEPPLLQTNTTKGVLYTTTHFCLDEPITPASPSEIASAYQALAEMTMRDKKATSLALSAVVLELSRHLISEKKYNKINVQICKLQNWSHFLIRITHSSKRQSLFYDPWFQRCHTSEPNIPKLFSATDMAHQMNIFIRRASKERYPSIRHIYSLLQYDSKTKKIGQKIKNNDATDLSYCILCSSSGTFLNPNQVVAEPDGWNDPDFPALSGCVVC